MGFLVLLTKEIENELKEKFRIILLEFRRKPSGTNEDVPTGVIQCSELPDEIRMKTQSRLTLSTWIRFPGV